MASFHKVKKSVDSVSLLIDIKKRRPECRMWFAAYGQMVGVWQSKRGKWYAVGHNNRNEIILYRTMEPQ